MAWAAVAKAKDRKYKVDGRRQASERVKLALYYTQKRMDKGHKNKGNFRSSPFPFRRQLFSSICCCWGKASCPLKWASQSESWINRPIDQQANCTKRRPQQQFRCKTVHLFYSRPFDAIIEPKVAPATTTTTTIWLKQQLFLSGVNIHTLVAALRCPRWLSS